MKITNKYNLPEVYVKMLQVPTYNKGKAHLSATELLQPPQLVQLRKKLWNELEEDVSDALFKLFGTAFHLMMEQNVLPNEVSEERLHATLNGWNISGAIDRQRIDSDGVVIMDYKTVGVWAVMNTKIDWEQQLNIYAWLVEHVKKIPVKKLEIHAFIKDWNRRDSKNKEGYPKASIEVIDIPLWSFEVRENFIKERISLHSNAALASEIGEDYAPCTPVEMWEKPTMWAIKKAGNKRATNVCLTLEDAEAKKEELGKGYEIEVRPGERTRCAEFCQVSGGCKQYQEYLTKQTEEV